MWTIMLLLGAYHGINPGMGWLFAVALGMQQGSARGVWRALPPIGLGHALAVGVVLLAAGLAQLVVPLGLLKVTVASILLGFGVYRLWRHRHPRYGGMRVGFRSDAKAVDAAMPPHTGHMTAAASAGTGSILLGLHTLSYLAVTGLAAWIVYRWLGLALLRTAWFNLDLLWAAVLAVTGAVVLLS